MVRILTILVATLATSASSWARVSNSSADVVPVASVKAVRPGQAVPSIARLVRAIGAIRAPHVPLSMRYKRTLARAALNAQRKTGVNPLLMIAIARVESDFRGIIRPGLACNPKYPKSFCWADCGVTQHHVRGTTAYVLRYCKYLRWSPQHSFLKSAQEIAYLQRWCKVKRPYTRGRLTLWDKRFDRCVLNQYNGGTYYRRAWKCWRLRGKKRLRCLRISTYWRKVLCFKYGADRGIKSKNDQCRRYKWHWKVTPAEIRRHAYPNSSASLIKHNP